ncbi:GNAT family acetyltransferase [Sandarakinorhabdus sp. AAP62]|uniref:GNAT family acetyltransferase n=1 Tax=Sandarakinorhabdus sp. AAP62 TaxID=1248916 RepID=UPI00031C9320|nr:GNAT family acetyltransferase [Sandarakinorhabdus sp. AAP62]
MIAPLSVDAIPAAVSLWQAAGLTRPWNDPVADAKRALAGPSSTILAIHDGDRLLGTVMVGHDGHRGWVYYLAVADDCRRAGHGRTLMAAAMNWLRAAGVPRLNLMVRHGNDAVLGFYLAQGFRQAEVHVLQHDL